MGMRSRGQMAGLAGVRSSGLPWPHASPRRLTAQNRAVPGIRLNHTPYPPAPHPSLQSPHGRRASRSTPAVFRGRSPRGLGVAHASSWSLSAREGGLGSEVELGPPEHENGHQNSEIEK